MRYENGSGPSEMPQSGYNEGFNEHVDAALGSGEDRYATEARAALSAWVSDEMERLHEELPQGPTPLDAEEIMRGIRSREIVLKFDDPEYKHDFVQKTLEQINEALPPTDQ